MILLLSIVVLLVVVVQFAPLPFLSPLRVQQSLHRSRRERSALIVSHSQKKKMLFKVLFVVCLLFVHSIQGVRKCGLNPNVIHLKRGEKTHVSYWTEEPRVESAESVGASTSEPQVATSTTTQLPNDLAESRQGIEDDEGNQEDLNSPSDSTVTSLRPDDVPVGMTTSKVTDDDDTTTASAVQEDGVTDQPQQMTIHAGDETEFITTTTSSTDDVGGAGESIVTESTTDATVTELLDEFTAGTTESSIAWTTVQVEGSGGDVEEDQQVAATTTSAPVIPTVPQQQQMGTEDNMAGIQIELAGENFFKTIEFRTEANSNELSVTTEADDGFISTTVANDDSFEVTTYTDNLVITHKKLPEVEPEVIPDVEFIRADETESSIGAILREMSQTVQVPQEEMAQMKEEVESEVEAAKVPMMQQEVEPRAFTTIQPNEAVELTTAANESEDAETTTNWFKQVSTEEPTTFTDSPSSMPPDSNGTEIPESITEAQVADERTDSESPQAEFRNDDVLINRIRTIVESLTNPKETPFFRRTSDFFQSVFQRRQERSVPLSDPADLIRRSDPSFIKFIRAQPMPMRRALSANFAGRFSRHIDDLSSDGNQASFEQECDLHIKTEPTLHLLLTFHNLSAPYTVDCAGAYVEIEREGNGFEARWCGNPIGQQRGVRSHVIFARSEVRVSVYNNRNILRQQLKPNEGHNDLDASSETFTEESVPTGFNADVEVIDLHDAGEYKTFQRSEAYSSVRRRVG